MARKLKNYEPFNGGYLYECLRSQILWIYNSIFSKLPSKHIRLFLYRLIFKFPIGNKTAIWRNVYIRGVKIEIGSNCIIADHVMLDGRVNKLTIGNNVAISPYVYIWTLEHDPNSVRFVPRGGDVNIKNNVWIASNAIILPGITIGEGAVIASGAIVTGDVAPYTIVSGNPAVKIKDRNIKIEYKLNIDQF